MGMSCLFSGSGIRPGADLVIPMTLRCRGPRPTDPVSTRARPQHLKIVLHSHRAAQSIGRLSRSNSPSASARASASICSANSAASALCAASASFTARMATPGG
jgi:hypothetical protein